MNRRVEGDVERRMNKCAESGRDEEASRWTSMYVCKEPVRALILNRPDLFSPRCPTPNPARKEGRKAKRP